MYLKYDSPLKLETETSKYKSLCSTFDRIATLTFPKLSQRVIALVSIFNQRQPTFCAALSSESLELDFWRGSWSYFASLAFFCYLTARRKSCINWRLIFKERLPYNRQSHCSWIEYEIYWSSCCRFIEVFLVDLFIKHKFQRFYQFLFQHNYKSDKIIKKYNNLQRIFESCANYFSQNSQFGTLEKRYILLRLFYDSPGMPHDYPESK